MTPFRMKTFDFLVYFSRTDELKHYVATTGSSSVVKHFLNKSSEAQVQFNQTIETISLTDDGKW